MTIFFAGAISANLKPLWREFLQKKDWGGAMGIFLAGQAPWKESGLYDKTIETQKVSILESFYYANDFTERMIPYFGKFLLDSGAFTFLQTRKGGSINWDSYVEKYADFIMRNNIKHFFELDIDPIIGIKGVERLRRKLESLTGRQSIPVWHKSRGKDYYLGMCKDYKYISIGGIVSKEIKREEYKFFPWLIDKAHECGARIHGLGFTNLEGLTKYHFDSVDSTSWTTGNRFGSVYKFNGKTMIKFDRKPNEKMVNVRELALNNFNEWVKFQKYAEVHL